MDFGKSIYYFLIIINTFNKFIHIIVCSNINYIMYIILFNLNYFLLINSFNRNLDNKSVYVNNPRDIYVSHVHVHILFSFLKIFNLILIYDDLILYLYKFLLFTVLHCCFTLLWFKTKGLQLVRDLPLFYSPKEVQLLYRCLQLHHFHVV